MNLVKCWLHLHFLIAWLISFYYCIEGEDEFFEEKIHRKKSLYIDDAEVDTSTDAKYAEVTFVSESINDITEKGETYLTSAASAGSLAIVKNYIKAGADVNKTNVNGNTALMAAVERGRYMTSVELIRAFTDITIRNRAGMTALLYAISGNHVDIVIAILNTGRANINEALPNGRLNGVMMAAQNNYWETLEILISRGAKLNTQTATGETAVMFAAVSNAVNATKLLIEARADINLQNNNELTPLMLAASRGHSDIVQLLLTAKCNVFLRDNVGYTAYDYAFDSNHKDIMELLKAFGATRSRKLN